MQPTAPWESSRHFQVVCEVRTILIVVLSHYLLCSFYTLETFSTDGSEAIVDQSGSILPLLKSMAPNYAISHHYPAQHFLKTIYT